MSCGVGETADVFAQRMVSAIDSAGLTLLLSIGHQLGLLDVLAEQRAATSSQIARAANLDERYVREWLGGMTVAGVLDYDPDTVSYTLPAHRAEVLTRTAGPANLARVTQYIPLLAEVEQKIIDCFHNGGGLSYSDYPRFHRVMAERSGEVFDRSLIDVVIPLVPGLLQRLREGIDLADFGCGSGHAVNLMAQTFPASRFTGIDFSGDAIAAGTHEAARRGLTNVTFEDRNLAELSVVGTYDAVTAFDAIHDQADPARVLANIHRSLRLDIPGA